MYTAVRTRLRRGDTIAAMSIDALNERFAIDGVARFVAGEGSLPRLDVTGALGGASIYPHGAHVSRFVPAGAEPVLWMSAASRFEAGKAIRGGVPIIFPWFADKKDDPEAPAHGLVRQAAWSLDALCVEDDGRVVATLSIAVEAFELVYRVTIGRRLHLSLEVTNTGDAAAAFEQALHTYLAVGDIARVSVEGLAGCAYIDKVDGFKRKMQGKDPIVFAGETDAVYVDTNAVVRVSDPAMGRTLVVGKTGSRSTIVWNPWIDKAARMGDFGDDEWGGMVCIETANVADNTRTLGPGGSHEMTATIGVE